MTNPSPLWEATNKVRKDDMKSTRFYLASFLGGLLALFAGPKTAAETTSPSSVLMKIYGVAVSTSQNCTNPTVIFNSDTATVTDFVKKPDIGGGAPGDGTYPCVIIKMSDFIRFKPKTSIAYCNANSTYTLDVCQTGTTSTSWDGVSTNCQGSLTSGQESVVYLYLSRNGATGNAGFTPETALPMSGDFVVQGKAFAKFVANFTNKVSNDNGECDCQPPDFGFVKINPPSE